MNLRKLPSQACALLPHKICRNEIGGTRKMVWLISRDLTRSPFILQSRDSTSLYQQNGKSCWIERGEQQPHSPPRYPPQPHITTSHVWGFILRGHQTLLLEKYEFRLLEALTLPLLSAVYDIFSLFGVRCLIKLMSNVHHCKIYLVKFVVIPEWRRFLGIICDFLLAD
jgi:hypothetical protein